MKSSPRYTEAPREHASRQQESLTEVPPCVAVPATAPRDRLIASMHHPVVKDNIEYTVELGYN